MATPSGGFAYTSDVVGACHDPIKSLASSCIRTAFGPLVQAVTDCLGCRGELTLKQIMFYLQNHTKRKCISCFAISKAQIRAALIVLLQQSIVTTKRQPSNHESAAFVTSYIFHSDRAIYIQRYPKFVEYIKKVADATAACLIEELLLHGRLRTVDVVVKASEQLKASEHPKSDKYTTRQTVVDSFCKLVHAGFIEQVVQFKECVDNNLDPDDGETELQFSLEPPKKKMKVEPPNDHVYKDEDPAVVLLLKSQHLYRAALPVDTVWRVNKQLFHETFASYSVGKLVAERHGHKIQSAGSLVTAALRYRAHMKYGVGSKIDDVATNGNITVFSTENIVKYLPKPVLQLFEKKVGGMSANISKSLQDLCERHNPPVMRRIGEDRYEIMLVNLSRYLHDKIFYQIVYDRFGEVSARILAILAKKGWLESDTIAEHAMVPVKDTREALHQLYRAGYIDLFHITNARAYLPTKATYLWCLDRRRLMQKITENVAYALLQIRLRREHEVEAGKQWIERAQQAEDTDENDHQSDKLNYKKFCLGLERLDVASQQLDETLLALRDF
jgi:DNA-directed RNA polymerase III subunit RPC3